VSLQVRWSKGGTKSAGLVDPGMDGRIILKWMYLVYDRVQWQAVVNMIMNLQVP
jgi:hypothetical protein